LGPAWRAAYDDDGSSFCTSLRAALSLAASLHDEQTRGYEHVVLVTDGDDLAGNWQLGVERLENTGMNIHVLGVGDKEKDHWIPSGRADDPYLTFEGERVTTRRRDDLLQELATAAKGEYQAEESAVQPLAQWFEQVVAPLPLREWSEDRQPLLTARYAWFYGAALALFVIAW